ncbi:nitrite reductase large subunit [Nocardiopsis sp. HNM0947]|uniref:assimilatory sulfite reductase (ferredoxin) n=1 Tax=Nocardiopsis coralli TaxID=2772213 RepID=A0ABR9P6K3_9ACTN|nr:nitrite reductase large subunit NirB [Nocardiopsis coralli]MBE2999472.1 nitrite reductase large subunit [Nocardiopsis coralli]
MHDLLVIGNGMVGHRLVQALHQRDTTHQWRITVLGEEPRPAYDRVALSTYADGATEDDLALPPLTSPNTRILTGHTVTHLDPTAHTATTTGGTTHHWDRLVLATGSDPFVPPIPGHDLPGCHTYRTIDDLDAITRAAAGARTGAVIGGGLLGLEAANALRLLGLDTHVIELADHLMPAQLDPGAGHLLATHITDLGLHLHTGAATTHITTTPQGTNHLHLDNGTTLDADLVVFSVGIRPRDHLARQAGLELGPRGGAAIDHTCTTSHPDILAIGEVASHQGTVHGLIAPGNAMADTAADHLTGHPAHFTPARPATELKLLGADVASLGDAHATTPGALDVVVNDTAGGRYAKLVLSDDATTLLGAVLVGDTTALATLRPLLGHTLPGDPLALISPNAPAPTATDLPATAQICSCNAVTKNDLTSAIDQGCHTLDTLKNHTGAGTSCGSCVPTLTRLLNDAGIEQSTALCEHFTHSRADLHQIVRASGIRTFSELITTHGTGRGCHLCKPAIASILASAGTGHILQPDRAHLQDTNDRHLANMQRNGTYSVVPRIPGGEITPDKLITIGQVARDFDLYTKITGAQRVDLLGARLEQLPHIWRRLVDAGFESGHAYGKSLRTVKSCVGTTWCRYGVQDSVTLAIRLEERYRGLRAPHKLKSAVSGCARECAEARSKDFGIIATDTGWNLYVGGNGGFTPRHAQLLATDLDEPTLIRTIDRFLMYYIRTADRLQRTAPWIENLDGGLDHLREVVLDDSLGIAADLEQAMEEHVAHYTDEWADVLNDPDKLARFTTFTNAPHTPDPTIAFTTVRDQPVPTTPTDLGLPTTRPQEATR